MKKINDAYIRARFGEELPQKDIDSLRTAMQSYGDNHWWESEDPIQVAMYQIFEKVLMTDFSKFRTGLEAIVGRPVYTHDLVMNVEELRTEVRLGIERLKNGIETSDEYKARAVQKSIKMLKDHCQKTGKKFLEVDLTEKSDRDENGIDQSGYDGWMK